MNYEGDILVNGKNLKLLGTDYYNQFGVILQVPFMFNDSFYNNICLYEETEVREITDCLKKLEITHFLRHHCLTDDYKDTEDNLSDGEKQKIAMARMMLKHKKFVLLDEASSYVIEKNLLENKEMTVINIEHKLIRSLLPYYDKIYQIRAGSLYDVTQTF